jgi:Secretion system C-terminal sorting domain
MIKNIFLISIILFVNCISHAQQALQSFSKYTINPNTLTWEITDSAQFYFSNNRYKALQATAQLDSLSYFVDSAIQYIVPPLQYINKTENTFDANNRIMSRATYDKSNTIWYWKKLNKIEYAYDANGNKTLQKMFNGATVTQNIFFDIDKYAWLYNSNNLPTAITYAKFNYSNSNWETKDSSNFSYGSNNLYTSSDYHDFGTGLTYTAENIQVYYTASACSTTYRFNSIGDSLSKYSVTSLGTDKDSIAYATYLNPNNWLLTQNVKNTYYPGTKLAYNKSFGNSFGITEYYTTDFAGTPTDYTRPVYYTYEQPNIQLKKVYTAYYNITKPLPVEIKTVNYNQAGTAIYSIVTDSLFYDSNDQLILKKSKGGEIGGYQIASKVVYTYTSDKQLLKEALTYYDSTAQAYINKWSAYTYNYYYSNMPNAISEESISKLNISPNPVQTLLSVSDNYFTKNTQLQVYDALGKTMPCNYTMQNNSATIDVKALQPGIYFLQVVNESKKQVAQFIKE